MAEPKDPDGLRQSLGQALDHDRKRRQRRRGRSYSSKPAKATGGFNKKTAAAIEIAIRREDQTAIDIAVPKEAQRHGDYRLVDFKIQEVIEGGKVKAKTARVIRNCGATTIERWAQRGKLDERRMAAILFYQAAWAWHIGEPKVTANYSPGIARGAGQAIELWASSRMRAKESLRLLDQEVFFRIPVEHFQVWQNVVLWDEPAGVAGGRVGFCHKPAEAAALLIVGLVASMIADVVISDTPKDWGELLLDLDAPRRARGGKS